MAEHSINVHVIDGDSQPTQNTAKAQTPQSGGKLSRAEAQQQLSGASQAKAPTAVPTAGALKFAGITALAGKAVDLAMQGVNYAQDYNSTTYSIRGADYKAMVSSHKMNQLNAGAGLAGAALKGAAGGAIAGSVIFPGVGTAAGAAIGAAVSSIEYTVSKAFTMAQDNRKYLKEIQVSRQETNYYQNRIRQNISGRR